LDAALMLAPVAEMFGHTLNLAWGVILLPLASAAVIGLLGTAFLRRWSHWPAILGVAGSLLCSVALFAAVRAAPARRGILTAYDWILTGSPRAISSVSIRLLVDPLTVVMLLTVCSVSLLVIIYSRSYMRDHSGVPERGYERFFAFMSLFVASMCVLVLAGDFLLLYLGWEAVGLCSYLLIGFYYPRPSAADAARKAFIVNRIGDFGFALGILLIWLTYGTLRYDAVFEATRAALSSDVSGLQAALGLVGPEARQVVAQINARVTPIALLLLAGALGKSAQLPLHVWLPDAMEGPTPVSALIHAATMVTAGVYMLVRCGWIIAASLPAMALIAIIGALTAFFAATVALAQYDMKRILAYSTISQLGYMFLAIGVFAPQAAIFHLYTHAFFKALLFLGAGSVMHALSGTVDIRQFRGLARVMPWTAVTFWAAALALAGVPFTSGFWSKDQIIAEAMRQSPLLGWLALLTAGITAFYTFRLVLLAFHGELRLPAGITRVCDADRWMRWPMVALAVGALVAGYVGVRWHVGGFAGLFEAPGAFQAYLAPIVTPFERGVLGRDVRAGWLTWLSAMVSLSAVAIAWYVYLARPSLPEVAAERLYWIYVVLNNKYYVDELYEVLVVRPLKRTARLLYAVDRILIDGLVYLVALAPRAVGLVARTVQYGAVQGYALFMVTVVGLILLLMVLV